MIKKTKIAYSIKGATFSTLVASSLLASGILSGDRVQALTLQGDTVTVTNIYGGEIYDDSANGNPNPATVVVGEGFELFTFGDIWDIDIGATSIVMVNKRTEDDTLNGVLDEYIFKDLDLVDASSFGIVGFTLSIEGPHLGGVDPNPRVTFGPHFVKIAFDGDTALIANSDEPQTIRVDLEFQHIPEPTTILGTGLALGFGSLFRRQYARKKSS